MNEQTPVLDSGYVQFIESWGSDERIIESARMSTAKGFLGWGPKHTEECAISVNEQTRGALEWTGEVHCTCKTKTGDEKLLKFLWDKQHASPFEFSGFTIEVKAPLFVFREWHRHRTQSYNEMSARYVPLPDENYMPTVERILLANSAGGNKQAQGTVDGKVLTEQDALDGFAILADLYDHSQRAYDQLLALGWPKELARLPVTVGRYSAMRATANLRNWLGFCTLRCAPGAQWEIRQYANMVADIVKQRFPRTFAVAADSIGCAGRTGDSDPVGSKEGKR